MKTTLNPFENAKRTANGTGGVSPSVIEEIQAEISVLGSQNTQQAQDITDIKAQLEELAVAYSSTEVKTGETYNGADVYTKEITLAQPTAIPVTDYPTLIADATGYSQFISCVALQQGGGCLPVNVFVESGAVKTHTFDAYTCTGYIVKYTKTGA